MNTKKYYAPVDIAEYTIQAGVTKANRSRLQIFILGVLAGIFIAFASEGSTMASFNLLANADTYGLGKTLSGAIFGTGLIIVMIGGAELFTGNCLMIMSVFEKKIKTIQMLRNWFWVYLGNFVGSLIITYMMSVSGLFHSGDNGFGAVTIKLATQKANLDFTQALVLGIMCNILVCMAVWMCYGARDITGKIWAIFFPIWLFITSGFEHSIANMYYIPAGILAKMTPEYVDTALQIGVNADKLANLTWGSFFVNNLLPVTLGNILGGVVFVAIAYWYVYIKCKNPRSY